MTSDTAVRIRGLVKRYGENTAVAGIDLDIHRGEVFSLLGPNGAGKTTTVEILEGYRTRDGGEVDVLGKDPQRGDLAWRSRLGIVLQTSQETPQLSVEELVRHFAGYYPRPRDPDEVIAAVGLEEKRSTRTTSLSGGQRRRLDVALGIVGAPELLFLDEPTTGFDPEARRSFWDLIRDLRGDGTSILLTTHYLDEAEQLADRVGVIAAGRLLALDSPERLGGRMAHQARVRWEDGAGRHEEATEQPTRLVTELAARYGGEVPGLQVVRPSLEDVYLQMIGSGDTAVAGEGARHDRHHAARRGARALDAPVALGRASIELKQFFRQRDSLVFTFMFPVILLFIFGSVFTDDIAPGVSFTQYFAAGMVASGVMLSSFQSLAIGIAIERDDGTLKRLRGTPMPPASYFLGKVGLVLATSLVQTAILLVVGALFFGLDLPTDAGSWIRFAWVFVLGTAAGTVLGIAYSSVPRSSRSAAAVVSPVVLVLQFISGVFFVYTQLPGWMQDIAQLFPLKWLAQGMRSVFLPDAFAAQEAGGSWQLPLTAAVLAAWAVVGLLLCLRTFRWLKRDGA